MNSSEWRKIRLGDALEALIDYRGKTPRKVSHGIPLITAKIVKNGFIQEPNEFIANEDYADWMVRGFPSIGDVVLTMEAPLGEVAQINDEGVALAQRIVTLRGKKDLLDNTYLKYFLKSEIGQARLKERETGTTVTGIKQSELRLIEIDLPPLPVQSRIAAILSALDSKIQLNFQINSTLEAIAQCIFQEWFVNFRFPGSTNKMEESKLGPIPIGWRVGKLGEIVEFIKGTSYQSSDLQPSFNALVTLKSINRGGGFNSDGFKEFTGKYKESQVLVEGDLVVSQTDITQNAAVVGCPAIVENPNNYEKLITSLDIVKCKPITDIFSSEVLYYFLKQQNFKDYCLSHTNGSTVLHLRSSELPNFHLIIPHEIIMRKFQSTVTPIRHAIINNNSQNYSLSRIRDFLLPKLMRGEIKV